MKKWIFRLLIVFAVLTAIALFTLKIVAGTSAPQKNGLEQAFSQIFRGEATFRELKKFNLIPQMNISIEGLDVQKVSGTGRIEAEKLEIAFGPLDLLLKNRVIEVFQVENLKVSEGVVGVDKIHLKEAMLRPKAGDDKAALPTGEFYIDGSVGDYPIRGSLDMKLDTSYRPKYSFNPENPFQLALGDAVIKGLYYPFDVIGGEVGQVQLTYTRQGQSATCQSNGTTKLAMRDFAVAVLAGVTSAKSAPDIQASIWQDLCGKL